MSVAFILNPAAGHGRAEPRWKAVAAALRADGLAFETWKTARRGDGVTLARGAVDAGFDAIVAVGGDGTLREVVDGLMRAGEAERARIVAGTWPAGSGCDAARHLGLSASDPPERLIRLLRERPVRRLDVGRVRYRDDAGRPAETHFFNVAALGMAGESARRIERSGKRWGGPLSYLLNSLGVLATAPIEPVELVVDGRPEPPAPLPLVAIANASCFGGGMRVADGADMADGAFDLITIAGWSRWRLLRHFPKVYKGGDIAMPGYSRRRIRTLEARAERPVWLNVDGEALGTLPAAFEVLPAALPFLVLK